MLGGLYLIFSQDTSVINYASQNPQALWLVGPLFAAVTGLCFKEGVCYGKSECGILTLLIPVWCLGHLSGLTPSNVETAEAFIVAALLMLFATGKFQQPVYEDIGDKSIFEFQKLSVEQQEELARKIQLERQFGNKFEE
eukprot:TRINITY_DN13948_c0_g1_i3.p1 TRINITY_DN13948_c0_g1~~TRINITY_DN13948_c0_g1_i3.p1  ORF type:complete len:139 (-),score=20.69 TRINITY_DN13948_c0_g1_i3:440-856(-)